MARWEPTLPPFKDHKKAVFAKVAEVGQFIYQIGESPILRQVSQAVPVESINTPEQQEKIMYVKNCLMKYREITGTGRAIAAVQVGIPERFAVIYSNKKLINIINPTITLQSHTLLSYPEICMSANPIISPTVRPSWIEFDYYDETGTMQQWKTKDDDVEGKLLNRVFQHEIDHMDGIINIDLVDSKQLILESDPDFYKNAAFKEV